MKPKYLRVTQAGYETYTGFLGTHEFKDGVSIEKIGLLDRDRLALAFAMEEFDDGEIPVPAGVAERMVRMKNEGAEIVESLVLQTEEEKQAEMAEMAKLAADAAFNPQIYTKEELEKIADKRGLSGLREVADVWKLKARDIATMIEKILTAQDAWSKSVDVQRAERIKAIEESQSAFRVKPEITETVAEVDLEPENISEPELPLTDVQQAAATGDLAASISTQED